jgi:hypothetical protein
MRSIARATSRKRNEVLRHVTAWHRCGAVHNQVVKRIENVRFTRDTERHEKDLADIRQVLCFTRIDRIDALCEPLRQSF